MCLVFGGFMNNKKNAHYRSTHESIKTSFLSLTKKKSNITIGDICEKAGINRSTFYLHYSGVGPLLEEIYRESFQVLNKQYESTPPDHPSRTPLSYESFQIICEHIRQNKEFYCLFFQMNTSFPIKEGFDAMWEHTFVPLYKKIGITDSEIMLHRFVCIQSAFTSTVRFWTENDCLLPVNDIATILHECIHL